MPPTAVPTPFLENELVVMKSEREGREGMENTRFHRLRHQVLCRARRLIHRLSRLVSYKLVAMSRKRRCGSGKEDGCLGLIVVETVGALVMQANHARQERGI